MTTKYVQPGNVMTRSNPGGSDADALVKVNRVWGVTLNGSATEPTGTLQQIGIEGVYTLPKLAEGIAQGVAVFSSNGSMTLSITGGFPVGSAFETVTTGATTVPVKLLGNAVPDAAITGAYA